MNTPHFNEPTHELPEDLRGVAGALDRLGAAERAGLNEAAVSRIASATGPGLRLTLAGAERPERVTLRVSWAVRIAAAVALLAGGYGLVVALRPTPTGLPGPTVASADPLETLARGLALLDAATPAGDLERLLTEAETLDAAIRTDFMDPSSILGTGSL